MTKYYAVVGAGYGDEGKGVAVDFLCRKIIKQRGNAIVIRHNGTAQASHTVTTPEALHRFSHFGSGHLAGQNVYTYFGNRFAMHPCVIKQEFEDIAAKYKKVHGDDPGIAFGPERMLHSGDCGVILPMDIALTQLRERRENHGSCGMGLFAQMRREAAGAEFSISNAIRLHRDGTLKEFLDTLTDRYYIPLAQELGSEGSDLYAIVRQFDLEKSFIEGLELISEFAEVEARNILTCGYPVIFESAQGLGLDPAYGTMPFCTPSNTGLCNPIAMLTKWADPGFELEAYYVTRTYGTRHGNGPLEGEIEDASEVMDGFGFSIGEMKREDTNEENNWQGAIRYGELDTSEVSERIAKDCMTAQKHAAKKASTVTAKAFITWLDAIDSSMCNTADERLEMVGGIALGLATDIGLPLGYFSAGPMAKDVYVPVKAKEAKDGVTDADFAKLIEAAMKASGSFGEASKPASPNVTVSGVDLASGATIYFK